MLVIACSIRGDFKKFVTIESKSFDLSVVGNEEEILKILENGKGRDFRSFWAGESLG